MTGYNEIIHGDCLEVMRGIEESSIDLVVTDPPYFIPAKHYCTRKAFRRNFADLGIIEGFFSMWFKEVERVLKHTGNFYIFCDGQSYPLFYYHAFPFTKAARPLIWDKKRSFTGFSWRHQHELILFGQLPESPKVPTGDGDILRCAAVKVGERVHPAEKPVELVKGLIEKSSDVGDLVLDPFAGSGTTGVACKMLGRRFVGIELEQEYVDIANARLATETKQTTML